MFYRFFPALLLLLLPLSTQASVIINEIAWMGDTESANHEWIELYNSGEEVVVDGWILSDGANLGINLLGTIPASSHVVLERSSEESSPASAFLIYTGALVNTGATLILKNANGEIMDQVAGGENWQEVGGDNTNKDTAQYTSQGWVTDIPTPKAQNRGGRVEPIVVTTNESAETKAPAKTTTNNTKAKEENKVRSVSLVTPNTILKLATDMQDVAYVNQTIPFSVEGSGIGETIIDSLVYTWNFGDTYVKTGKKVEHAFAYPGTYVVTINAKYARHDETIRREITVLPVSFSITKNDVGDIQIQNDSPYDVDMSGFVVWGEKEVIFPPKTIILPKATITIAKKRLGLNEQEKLVTLYDTKGNVVTSNFDKFFAVSVEAEEQNAVLVSKNLVTKINVPVSQKTVREPALSHVDVVPDFIEDFTTQALASEDIVVTDFTTDDSSSLEESSNDKKPKSERWPYVVFTALIILSLFGIYLSRR
jgi:hypothetical protein